MIALAFDVLFIVSLVGGVALTVRSAIGAQGWRLLALFLLFLPPVAGFAIAMPYRPLRPFAPPDGRYFDVFFCQFLVNIALSGVLYAWLKGARSFAAVIVITNFVFNLLLTFGAGLGY